MPKTSTTTENEDEVFYMYHNFTDQQKRIGATTVSKDEITISNEYEITKKITNYSKKHVVRDSNSDD